MSGPWRFSWLSQGLAHSQQKPALRGGKVGKTAREDGLGHLVEVGDRNRPSPFVLSTSDCLTFKKISIIFIS
jgi:hypothetical protein